ncbi:MAG: hypothetical protein J1F39_07310 [Clostridiales bacterium]|nr:hypothetical protein [Clostridiales bacterium]
MIDLAINGVILRVNNKALGAVGDIPVLGKTIAEWVGAVIRAPYKIVEWSSVINMIEPLRAAVDKSKPVTVVLFSDTPLIGQETLSAAVKALMEGKGGALALPRGYVFKTSYLFETETLFLKAQTGDGQFTAVTDSESLTKVTEELRRRIIRYHSSGGVIFTDVKNTYVDCDVIIESKTVIEPYNFIKGKTIIKAGAHIMPGNYIEDCIIGRNAVVDSSRLYGSSIGAESHVGPFSYIRPNSVVGSRCRIGDFVELKNCVIGDGTKVCHLSYIGDAELGRDCNVGCGVIFANYDGKNKYKSLVGNRVFIGSNSNIVAPVTIEDRAFIAAGSTITKSVPSQALAVARARQTHIPDWKGNVYAPPPESARSAERSASSEDTRTAVSFADGIIDGEGSDNPQ